MLFIAYFPAWRTAKAAGPILEEGSVTVRVYPAYVQPGGKVHLTATGLLKHWPVQAGLRTNDMNRELFESTWTDERGSISVELILPETAQAGETRVGFVTAGSGERDSYQAKGTVLIIPGPFTYRVRPGDTLGEIAGWFHTTITDILIANPEIQRANRIYVGQKLVIRVGSAEKVSDSSWPVYRIPDYTGMNWERSLVRGVLAEVWEDIRGQERWIDVDLSAQIVRAYQGERLVRLFVVSTGRARTPTITGKYTIYVKHRYVNMSGPGYFLKDVPYTMYFYKGYSLHGTYWHHHFGRPMSHGCVNLSVEDAEWLYHFAEVGTLVHIHN